MDLTKKKALFIGKPAEKECQRIKAVPRYWHTKIWGKLFDACKTVPSLCLGNPASEGAKMAPDWCALKDIPDGRNGQTGASSDCSSGKISIYHFTFHWGMSERIISSAASSSIFRFLVNVNQGKGSNARVRHVSVIESIQECRWWPICTNRDWSLDLHLLRNRSVTFSGWLLYYCPEIGRQYDGVVFLEFVTILYSEDYLLVLRNFNSFYGVLHTDNGTNFFEDERELR